MNQLSLLREYLKKNNLAGIIVPSNDPHFSEYIAPHYNCRSYISGFTGSAGTAVITENSAAVWVDSRYFIQVEQECKGGEFEVQKLAQPGTPTIAQWLKKSTPENSTITIDGKLFNVVAYDLLKQELAEQSLQISLSNDPFEEFWEGREPRPATLVRVMDVEISGESTQSKLNRLRDTLDIKDDKTHHIVTSLDEIAWLLNIRGADVPCNPVTIAYVVVSYKSAKLFIDNDKISSDNLPYFRQNSIDIASYLSFADYLKSLSGQTVVYTPAKTDIFHYNVMAENGVTLREDVSLVGTVNCMKSIKNSVEIEGFEKAMVEDGIAMARFYYWLHKELKSGAELNEYGIGEKMGEFRAKSELFIQTSFKPIVGMGPNGAMPHYSQKEVGSRAIEQNNFLLIDSGGQYICGTTDTTRTIHLSTPTAQQKIDYTLVLQGMIELTEIVFPINTRGAQLDILARKYLLSEAINYGHGTGHGVGHCLNVHEGPQSIRSEVNPEVMKAGMVMSNEPAMYRTGEYGVRTENMMVCEEFASNQFGTFLHFRTITKFPIETKSIDVDRLDKSQRHWINKYNENVYDTLASHLTRDEQMWLAQLTKAI